MAFPSKIRKFVANPFNKIIAIMKLARKITQNDITTSILFSERPTMWTGFLSVFGMTSTKRFKCYLQGNNLEDLQRDARVIANDFKTVLSQLNYGKR